MKIILSMLLITVASGFPIENEKYGFDFHYQQHATSVDNARTRMSQRLSEIEDRLGAPKVQRPGYTTTYCASCPSGYSTSQSQQSSRLSSQASSMQSSGSSSNVVEGSDYVGVGYVGHASDHQDELQARVPPSAAYGSGGRTRISSSNAAYHDEEEDEDLQQRLVEPGFNDIHSSAYRSSGNNREDVQSNIGYHDLSVNNEGNYESYSQRRNQQEQASESSRTVTQPQVYYVPAPVTSSTSQRTSEGSNSQRVSMVVRPGATTVLRVPVNVIQTPGVPVQQYNSRVSTGNTYQASGTETRPTSTYTVYYVPTNTYNNDRYASSGNQQDTSRTTVVQPEKYRTPDLSNYNSFNSQSRSQNEDVQETESYQTRVNPSTITDGGASRYSMNSGSTLGSSSLVNNQQVRVPVQPFPLQSIESSSRNSQRTAEEQEQRRYTPARPNYVHRTYGNNEEERSENSRTETSNTYVPVVPIGSSQSRLSQSQQQQQQSQFNSRTGSTFSPYTPGYPSGTSSRLGSGIAHSNTENLFDYMSESERLARLQQQQLAATRQSSSANSHSSVSEANRRTLDAAQRLDSAAASFVGSANLANRNSDLDAENIGGTGAGGYQRVKQWQKQSKWESGSQYGTNGTPTSFSMLSTAESEKHNINGAETGYKAATTTLENDGKVSTYSIHTP